MPISPPTKITVPFATSGLKNSIPANTNNVTGNAGYDAGFGAINMTPKTAGGIPPFGQDFNGIFFDITTALQFLEAGGSFPFDSAFATAVGGYPAGALVSRSDNSGLWRNTVANNTTNPETFGAGWQPEDAGATIVSMSSSNVTLTALQSAKSIIIISGTLTANLQLILPAYTKQWLIINGASGLFSVTVKTSAGSGFSVATGATQSVYGDGTNIGASLGNAPGRLLRTSIYTLNSAVQQVSVDGAAFTSTGAGTFSTLPQTARTAYKIIGSGGSGGGAQGTAAGQQSVAAGGGCGGYAEGVFVGPIVGASITIGAGGAAPTAGLTPGNSGGTTSISGIASAPGGAGGSAGTAVSSFPIVSGGGNGGLATGANLINARGASGGNGLNTALLNVASGAGGNSVVAGGGQSVGTTQNGSPAGGPGAGGSGGVCLTGTAGGRSGGAGGDGYIEIREYS